MWFLIHSIIKLEGGWQMIGLMHLICKVEKVSYLLTAGLAKFLERKKKKTSYAYLKINVLNSLYFRLGKRIVVMGVLAVEKSSLIQILSQTN